MVWLIVSQIVTVLALLPWTLFLGAFALAAALSTEQFGSNYGKHILAGCQLPVVLIASIIGAWITFRQKKLQLANILTSIPVVYVIPGLIAWLLNF